MAWEINIYLTPGTRMERVILYICGASRLGING